MYSVRVPEARWPAWEAQMTQEGRARFQLLREGVAQQLTAAGVVLQIVPLPLDPVFSTYWMDLVWDYTRAKHPKLGDTPVIIPVLKLGPDPGKVAHPDKIFMQHNGITQGIKQTVIAIMTKAFGSAFRWDGDSESAMLIIL